MFGEKKTRAQFCAEAESYNRIGRLLAAEGLRLCYYNHK